MANLVFLDSNIFVYSIDIKYPEKRKAALQFLREFGKNGGGVISTQVLQEFYSAATGKLKIDPFIAKQHVKNFQIFTVVQISPPLIEEGIDRSIINQLSFWDGLIIAAATSVHCEKILTEDMNHGQNIGGVLIENPFLSI